MNYCADTDHDYFKFDDATVVCRKCANQMVVEVMKLIEMLPRPAYIPCPGPHYPQYVPWWQPNTTWPVITYGSSTSDALPPNTIVIS